MNAPIRVLLVDDHPVVRTGYRHLLESDAGIEIIAEAADSATAYEAFKALTPDVVVMDISLPGVSGIETMKRMRISQPTARILIFSMHDESIFVSRAMRAGAAGFLSKSSAPENLIDAVRTVARGESCTPHTGAKPGSKERTLAANLDALSDREAEVLRLWSKGLTLGEIGKQLGVSEKTVANHQSLVRQKLRVNSDVQLVRMAELIWSGERQNNGSFSLDPKTSLNRYSFT